MKNNLRFLDTPKSRWYLPEPVKQRVILTFCVISLALFASSCSMTKIASDMTSGIFKAGSPVFERESDVEVAEVAGLAMIKTLEVFNFHNPTNKNYLNLLAKSYSTYAFGFLENRMLEYQYKDPEKYQMYFNRTKEFYKRGKSFGMDYLDKSDKSLVRALEKGIDPVRKRMNHYGRTDIEPVFWTAFSWGGLINVSKDDISVVADLALVEAMMARIVQVNPSFYFGAPHLFYGVYYASRPPMLGGSPEKSKQHFEEAAKLTADKSLMVFALEAQYLSLQTLNRGLFDELIAKVNAGSIDASPPQRLANALAKDRVKFLQNNVSHYF